MHRSPDLSFGSAANRKKIAVGELERIAAGDHRVAILEFDEAGIHRAAHEDKAELAFPALPVPAIDVRPLTHETPRFLGHRQTRAEIFLAAPATPRLTTSLNVVFAVRPGSFDDVPKMSRQGHALRRRRSDRSSIQVRQLPLCTRYHSE
jgi:hypothetical protein